MANSRSLLQRLQPLRERFDALSLRERGLALITVLVIIYFASDSVFLRPQHAQQNHIMQQMKNLQLQMDSIDQTIQALTAANNNPAAGSAATSKIEQLRHELIALNQRQNESAVDFIQPTEMAKMLKQILRQGPKLTLIRLESMDSEPLLIADQEQQELQGLPRIYKHGMLIEFRGDYLSTLRYLRRLESLPWRFYWDFAGYQVLKYPIANVKIAIHTLSLQEGWIGV